MFNKSQKDSELISGKLEGARSLKETFRQELPKINKATEASHPVRWRVPLTIFNVFC